ncbi:MAG TPA: GAF domain-containing sensor histidine kinase [Thermoanaerobaculia bacterium]|nr:GAF domain-containing sensor histidine kinase [Thermoanaerobaculia bacterium]
MRANRRSIWRVGPESTWTTVLPVAFIIVSLLSLVVLPLVVSNHTAEMRREITRVAEPARRAANQIQMDLSAELDKIIAFQVTGQEQYRTRYLELLQRQEQNRTALLALTAQLSPTLEQDLNSLFVQTGSWHNGVDRNEFLTRSLPSEVFTTRLFEQHPAYEKSLTAASELEVALQEGIEERLRKIREAERWNVSLTIILTLLALTSAMLVAGLGRQMRLLAGEATLRRKDAEREASEAKLARAAAEMEERRSAFLASAGQELSASLDVEETVATVAQLIVPNLAEVCVVDVAESAGTWRRAAARHRDAHRDAELVKKIGEIRRDVPEALVRILEARQAKIIGSSSEVYEYVTGSSGQGNRTMIVTPLISRGQTLGVIIAMAGEGRPFSSSELPLLAELARYASLAIDNARLYLASQQAATARQEVQAIVSHDLRSPLNAVMLGASLLQTSTTLSPDDREQVDTMALSARRMGRLIDDLLDVTRLEGGKRLPVEPARVEVSSLLEEARDLFKAQASASSISLRFSTAQPLPAVHADRDRVMQVLSNLIGNALKFTPPGGVVSTRAERSDDFVLFTVSDTGPGIASQDLPDIFNPYWQAKRAERMGAGLGLAISRGIVEAHGGRIWAESEPQAGTRFLFTLPLDGAESGAPTSTEESAARR